MFILGLAPEGECDRPWWAPIIGCASFTTVSGISSALVLISKNKLITLPLRFIGTLQLV